VGVTIVRQDKIGVLTIGQQGCKRPHKTGFEG
jgi:hypothetical protein